MTFKDIVERNTVMILGFCWLLLRYFGPNREPHEREKVAEEGQLENFLLSWVKGELEGSNIEIKDLSTGWVFFNQLC